MAQALGEYGIGVYTVAPGFVGTEMSDYIMKTPEGAKINAQSPLKRIARPEEVADTIVFLSSGNSEFLTGGIIDVNGASYLRS
jgi:NAD(P)-dependent dehydrogenase (short-subunit alcohol dehydrogenase family)